MPFPDHINTTAAAFYGLALAAIARQKPSEQPPTSTEEKNDPVPQNPIAPVKVESDEIMPLNWADAPQSTRDAFRKPAQFLSSYLRGNAARTVDRDETAMAVAKVCKDTLVASSKVSYRQMVEVFCAVQQSLMG